MRPLPPIQSHKHVPLWPYIVTFALLAGTVGAYLCYRRMTDPVPLSEDDEAGPMFVMLLYPLMAVFVLGCGLLGALFGMGVRYCVVRCSTRSVLCL